MIGISAWQRPVNWLLGDDEPMFTLTTNYIEKLTDLGMASAILPPGPVSRAGEIVSRLDALIISGGGDVDPGCYGAANSHSTATDPDRDNWEIALVRAAERLGVPTLGICRGLQLLTVAFGGSLHQHIWATGTAHPPLSSSESQHLGERPHTVEFTPGSRMAAMFGSNTTVNSYHHQAADRVPERFTVTGRAPDGVIEAIESADGWPAMAVQWHPERQTDTELFQDLVRLSEERSVISGHGL